MFWANHKMHNILRLGHGGVVPGVWSESRSR